MSSETRLLYRIIADETPTIRDFLPARVLGKPLLDHRYEREWSEGISAYDDLEHTIRKARGYRGKLGLFVAALAIPESDQIEVKQTTKDPHHFTVISSPFILYGLIEGPVTSIWRRQ